jgi:riboflavin synthase
MFTGIVTSIGKIAQAVPRDGGLRLTIDAGMLDLSDVSVGESIAVNGICLTVIATHGDRFDVDVSQETINCTVGLDDLANEVNLEKSLRLSDRLGGHMMSGHVDGVGEVVRFEPAGESYLLAIRAPADLAKYIARKGSITVNGVSLTVNRVDGTEFEINLIPHTIAVTNLKHFKPGSRVNLEVDLIARYIERLQHYGA